LLELIQGDNVTIHMKFFRSIAVMLILVLASTPTLAAICATSCASESAMASLSSGDMSEMQHCHEDSKDTHSNKPSAEYKSCSMGATCHFTQVISEFDSLSRYVFADLTSKSFPKFVPLEKSIDLSPPLKPPA
jgi:hypothetical protein